MTTANALRRPTDDVTAGSYGYVRALATDSGAVGDGTLLLTIDGTRMVNGDEFQQVDRRGVFVGSLRHRFAEIHLFGLPAAVTIGGDVRHDLIDRVGLYGSSSGARTSTIRQDRVDEASANLWGEVETRLSHSLRLTLGANAALYGGIEVELAVKSLPTTL